MPTKPISHSRVELDRSITPKPARRAAIYLRISKDRGSDEAGVRRQEKICRRKAKQLGWRVVSVRTDNEKSASRYARKKRKEFLAMLADIEAGRVDAVMVYNSDRLTREPKVMERLIDLTETLGLAWWHENGEIDLRTRNGRQNARFAVTVSASESDATSERYCDMHQEIAEEGRPSGGGLRPFGFEEDHVTHRTEEAMLIRQAARRVIAGQSVTSIAREWTAEGIAPATWHPPKRLLWRGQTVRRILTSARIAGIRELRRFDARTQSDEIVVRTKAAWDPIITRAQHEHLVRLLDNSRTRSPSAFARRYLLTGLAYCGRPACRGRLTGGQRNGKDGYMCSREGGCHRCGIAAEPVDRWVTAAFLAAVESPRYAKAMAAKRRAAAKTVVGDPYGDADRAEEQMAFLLLQLTRKQTTQKAYDQAYAVVADELADAKRRIEAITQVDELELDPKTIRREWGGWSLDKQRAALGLVIERVEIEPGQRGGNNAAPEDRIGITWRF